ncbi:MAG: Sua5/YciO/YrdC/YwlC family protein [Rhizobacter sp.]|nr:Sua5/YciO/YrdC/YwlC family protein [Bacteriovorax sp.]
MKLTSESVFIYPTDTVWGIGAAITSENAYKKIAAIKQTTTDKPLSIMFTDINILHKSFNFPEAISTSWLRNFFKLEATLGVPLKISKISIPKWVTAKSDLVSVRCLDLPALKPISAALNVPFFTTSLNVTGQDPIITFEDAKHFQQTHAQDAELIGNSSHNLSGRSSTIVFFRGSSFEIIREGLKVEEIKKHLNLTGIKIS